MLLNLLGMESVNVYAKAGWWKFIITGFSAWKGVGCGMVVYLASIARGGFFAYRSSSD
ncbi:MAG: hypothetical protein ACLTML_09070 [Blautia faecis]